jgi:hypothetical protein
MAPQVIFTCFAGRERYLKALVPYIERLNVDEVHMWDYTRNEKDAEYLRKACSKFQIFTVADKSNYGEYYKYYTKERYPDPLTVIVKCDDDIVFIDTSAFDEFIKARRLATDAILMSPAVVNNPVCGVIMGQRDILPGFSRSDFGMDAVCANKIHKHFLKNPKRFISECHRTDRFSELPSKAQYRFNINFIAVLAKDLSLFQNEEIVTDDEQFLGVTAPLLYQRNILLDLHFVVCHMAFTSQRVQGYDEARHLEKYRSLALEKKYGS